MSINLHAFSLSQPKPNRVMSSISPQVQLALGLVRIRFGLTWGIMLDVTPYINYHKQRLDHT